MSSEVLPAGVTLRLLETPVSPAEEEFLCALYGSTRADELALLPWDAAQLAAFIHFQHTAQLRYYQTQYPQASHQLILRDEQSIGRSYVDRRAQEIRILDLSLLPAYRDQGIGTALLRQLMDEAAQARQSLSVYLDPYNRSQRLFTRLAFQPVAEKAGHQLFEWRP